MKAHIDHYEPCIICNQIYDKKAGHAQNILKQKEKQMYFFIIPALKV